MSTKQSDKPAAQQRRKRRAGSRAQETTTVNKRTAKPEANEKQSRRAKMESKQGKARVRIFPVWLRIIIVLILAVAALVAGLMIGYGIIGEGTPADALKVETWQHIIDIVTKTE